ncbi:AAA family ATPase [Rheinheimera sp. UJ51]|uniref:AAA family ATPase n=1 Tax=Rheinheimera sp. UJ51 TaxID=2892446 RepID=UPI001E5F262B|nr:AAA family ATPase [Rheinheimera sp. UJ51]MCC5452881.1 AAA family ATPase [Rheinheimera sp. UJ51]
MSFNNLDENEILKELAELEELCLTDLISDGFLISSNNDELDKEIADFSGWELEEVKNETSFGVSDSSQHNSEEELAILDFESGYETPRCKVRNRKNILMRQPEFALLESDNDDLRQITSQICYLLTSSALASGHIDSVDSIITSSPQTECTEVTLIAALFGISSVMNRIAAAAGRSCVELKFPEEILKLRKQLSEQVGRRTYAVEKKGGNKNWFEHIEGVKAKIKFSNCAKKCLEYFIKMPVPFVESYELDYDNLGAFFSGEWICDFGSDFLENICSLNRSKHSVISKCSKTIELRKYCDERIFGQLDATSSVADMVSASLNSKQNSCLGIITFMGASGTGKTALAESLTPAINKVFGSGFHTLMLNMEMFSDEKSALKLFGSGSQYVDSALGDLTTEIICYPRTVIIVDEVEKAHPSVIQSMLTLLEKGKIKDQTTNKLVDFSQCFFIFTTNLGQKAVTKGAFESATVDLKSLLASNPSRKGLSPEFISRLSTGFIALFKPLTPKSLLMLAEKVAYNVPKEYDFFWPQNMAELILETLGGNLEPRSIIAQPAKLRSLILNEVCNVIEEHDTDPKINIVFPEDISEFCFAVLADEPQLKKLLKTQFKQCVVITSEAKLKTLKNHKQLTSLLLPCSVSAKLLTEAKKTGLTLYGIKSNPISYKQNEELEGFEKIYPLVDFSVAAFGLLVEKVAKRQRLLKNMAQWRSRNMVVSFDYQLDVNLSEIKITMQNPKYEHCFRHEDFEPAFMQTPCMPDICFDDLIGMDELKQKMGFVMQVLRSDNSVLLDMPKGYLLEGAPGTGKSHFAKAVAAECKVPFLPVNAADLTSGNVVENINHLFDVAERYSPCIIFFDEFDAIAIDRQNSNTGSRLAVNTLLTRLDGFSKSQYPVFVLAATNFVNKLDPAIKRHGRFDKVINIPLPDIQSRICFVEKCAQKYSFEIPINVVQEFSRKIEGVAYGFITNIFREIQLKILTENTPFNIDMLYEQILIETIGRKKTAKSLNTTSRRKVAYHETGHYLLNKRWFPTMRCTTLSIQEYEGVGGFVEFESYEGDNTNTSASFKAKLQVLLAGRAAEQLLSKCPDEITTGASDDISKATELAKMAISDFGLSETLGLADFKQLPLQQQKVEQEVLMWLNEAYNACKSYLQQHWDLVTTIAEALLEKEVMNHDTLDSIVTNTRMH